MANTKDMSIGRPLMALILFALPMVLSVSFQQLYNIADSVIAGQFLGKDALAAVSASYPITMIFMAVGTGLSVGCSVVTSRIYGEKDYNKLKCAVSTAFISFTVIAAAFTLVGYFSSAPLLALLNTPAEIMKDSTDYLAVYMFGLVFIFIYNSCSAVFQALGNSKIPLFFLIFSTLFNIALDVIFIKVGGMGVWSLSLATVVAQGIACLGSLAVLWYVLTNLETAKEEAAISAAGGTPVKVGFGRKIAKTFRSMGAFFFGKKVYRRFGFSVFKEVMIIGIPSVVQSSTVSIGQLLLQNLVNGFGTDVVAGYGAAMKINSFAISILATVGNALSIFVSQNLGAGKPERIRQGARAGVGMIVVLTSVFVPVIMIAARQLVSLFVDDADAQQVLQVGSLILTIITPFYFVVVFKFICDSVLKGVGAMNGFIWSTMVDLVLRVGCSYLFAYTIGGYLGIWWSWNIGWVVGAAVSVAFYFFGRWRKRVFAAATIESDKTAEK